ncbi:unnamed protein product [Ostreobium quekettii]|uniref:Uncharacterized protein n=1 Tax=Ostreobium quekettii TaxID=121088 RepID=A0A8S1JBM6_9CHLO|nr:unnamed protein product [Ostreobium quekettii]
MCRGNATMMEVADMQELCQRGLRGRGDPVGTGGGLWRCDEQWVREARASPDSIHVIGCDAHRHPQGDEGARCVWAGGSWMGVAVAALEEGEHGCCILLGCKRSAVQRAGPGGIVDCFAIAGSLECMA